jgi:uncharacterized membrane protein
MWLWRIIKMTYGCFGYGMMNGSYGYGLMLFSWLIGLLFLAGLVLFIIWIIKKIQNEDKKQNRRLK